MQYYLCAAACCTHTRYLAYPFRKKIVRISSGIFSITLEQAKSSYEIQFLIFIRLIYVATVAIINLFAHVIGMFLNCCP